MAASEKRPRRTIDTAMRYFVPPITGEGNVLRGSCEYMRRASSKSPLKKRASALTASACGASREAGEVAMNSS